MPEKPKLYPFNPSTIKFANTIFAMKKGGGQHLYLEKMYCGGNTKPVKTNLIRTKDIIR